MVAEAHKLALFSSCFIATAQVHSEHSHVCGSSTFHLILGYSSIKINPKLTLKHKLVYFSTDWNK